jgi:hypothetical protein
MKLVKMLVAATLAIFSFIGDRCLRVVGNGEESGRYPAGRCGSVLDTGLRRMTVLRVGLAIFLLAQRPAK